MEAAEPELMDDFEDDDAARARRRWARHRPDRGLGFIGELNVVPIDLLSRGCTWLARGDGDGGWRDCQIRKPRPINRTRSYCDWHADVAIYGGGEMASVRLSPRISRRAAAAGGALVRYSLVDRGARVVSIVVILLFQT